MHKEEATDLILSSHNNILAFLEKEYSITIYRSQIAGVKVQTGIFV